MWVIVVGILTAIGVIIAAECSRRSAMKNEEEKFKNDVSKLDVLFDLVGDTGRIVVCENKIIISRAGTNGIYTHGFVGSKTIPISSITSIQFKAGDSLTNGFIQFGVLGGHESTKGVFDAIQDENTVFFKESQTETAKKIKKYIENHITEKNDTVNNSKMNSLPTEEIIEYKKLLDMGIITKEEFEVKKKQLLDL